MKEEAIKEAVFNSALSIVKGTSTEKYSKMLELKNIVSFEQLVRVIKQYERTEKIKKLKWR